MLIAGLIIFRIVLRVVLKGVLIPTESLIITVTDFENYGSCSFI